jgi:hypothetical protein
MQALEPCSKMPAAADANSAPHVLVTSREELPPHIDPQSTFSVEVPGSWVGRDAFKFCYGLTSVRLPAGLSLIQESAFMGCENLAAIDLPGSIRTIESGAFLGCTSLASIALPEGITTIEIGAFALCGGLAAIALPQRLTTISVSAFERCCGLTSVVLPVGVTRILERAFHGCSCLVVVTLHCQLPMEIAAPSAFDECDRLTLVVAPRSSGLVGTVLGGVTVVEDTDANRRRALDLQYWRVQTHRLCSRVRRDWVRGVLLVADRLRGSPLALPREMWYMILGAVRRCELGPLEQFNPTVVAASPDAPPGTPAWRFSWDS